MEIAQTRYHSMNVHVQKATLEPTVKPISMNVTLNCVRMQELAQMVSIPTGVNAWTVMLGKTVKAISTNVDQNPVKMVVPVKMKSTLTVVPV